MFKSKPNFTIFGTFPLRFEGIKNHNFETAGIFRSSQKQTGLEVRTNQACSLSEHVQLYQNRINRNQTTLTLTEERELLFRLVGTFDSPLQGVLAILAADAFKILLGEFGRLSGLT